MPPRIGIPPIAGGVSQVREARAAYPFSSFCSDNLVEKPKGTYFDDTLLKIGTTATRHIVQIQQRRHL
jgi:hypothetical protein